MTGTSERPDRAARPPAHTRGASRPPRAERDRRSLVVRVPIVVAVAAVVVAAVAFDRAGREPGGAGGGPAADGARAALLVPAARPASGGSSTWYCAAGTASTGGPADHRIVMANPSGRLRHATLTIVAGDVSHPDRDEGPALPETVTRAVDLPAGGRAEVRLGDELNAPLAAAVVEVDGGGVAVEHRLVGPDGSDIGPCSPSPAAAWHLAWGTTSRDAHDLVVLFNPFPSPATVDATFVTEEGPRDPVRWQGFPVPAESVVAVDLADDVPRSRQVAATFRTRAGRIVVERLQLFDGSLGVRGLSLDQAAPGAGTAWVFADGAATAPTPTAPAPGAAPPARSARPGLASGEEIVVYNPGTERAEVDIQLVAAGGDGVPPEPFRLSVGPRAYDVVDYGGQARVTAGAHHSTVVRSTNGVPVVAERVTTDVYTPRPAKRSRGRRAPRTSPPGGETTATPGARLAARDWIFAALDAGGDTRASIEVYNPDPDHAVQVRVDPLGAGDDPAGTPVAGAEVAAGGRVSLTLPAGADARLDGVVARATRPVVVERSLRFADGRRQALAPGIPALAGARPLDELAAGGGGRDDR